MGRKPRYEQTSLVCLTCNGTGKIKGIGNPLAHIDPLEDPEITEEACEDCGGTGVPPEPVVEPTPLAEAILGIVEEPSKKKRKSRAKPKPILWTTTELMELAFGAMGYVMGQLEGESLNLKITEGVSWVASPEYTKIVKDRVFTNAKKYLETKLREALIAKHQMQA